MVTLVGPGGIGKTTLALVAAGRWQGDKLQRVWLVELAEIAASDDVPRAVGETLRVTEGQGSTLTDSVVAALRSRPTLLVLDNCEHVIDGAAVLARAVAENAPDARVLATSREGLRIADERLVALGPLDPAGAAAELFAERARAVSGAFDLDGTRSDVTEICRRLDGVPLAIELAAARIPSMTPSELLARLEQGERSLAFRMLRDEVDDLLATDSVDGVRLVAVEFVNMLADVDRLAEATRMLAYLDTTGGFGELARDTLVAGAVDRIAADPPRHRRRWVPSRCPPGPGLHARRARRAGRRRAIR